MNKLTQRASDPAKKIEHQVAKLIYLFFAPYIAFDKAVGFVMTVTYRSVLCVLDFLNCRGPGIENCLEGLIRSEIYDLNLLF